MKFLTALCIAALGSALFRMLVPENKFSKQISALIAGVFLLAGISAATGAEIDLDTDKFTYAEEFNADITSNANKSLREKICSEMSERIYSLLNEHGICPKEIHIAVNISGTYNIDITQIELVFKSGEQAAAADAAEILRGELPTDITISTKVV